MEKARGRSRSPEKRDNWHETAKLARLPHRRRGLVLGDPWNRFPNAGAFPAEGHEKAGTIC